jgi:hypothetical protein
MDLFSDSELERHLCEVPLLLSRKSSACAYVDFPLFLRFDFAIHAYSQSSTFLVRQKKYPLRLGRGLLDEERFLKKGKVR